MTVWLKNAHWPSLFIGLLSLLVASTEGLQEAILILILGELLYIGDGLRAFARAVVELYGPKEKK